MRWPVIRHALDQLRSLAVRAPEVDARLAWQLRALERAVTEERPELLPLAAGELTDAIVAWSYDRWDGPVEDLLPIALWLLGTGDAAGAERALDTWAEMLAR